MPEEPPYLCWADHAEDLTDEVLEQLRNPGRLTLYFERRSAGTSDQRAKIFARCSEDHLSVFDVALPRK